eukprot:jgi/Ulvmu1/4515/UM002_0241.1
MPDKDRQPFYCPYPGCKRKFASLWRLKVHYRAPPNERGSGKERGHGVELPICPACGEALQPKTHHNRCRAGRTSQPAKSAIKQRGKGSRSSNALVSAKRHLAKDEPKSNEMAAAKDAIGLPTALTESIATVPAKNAPLCAAVEYLDDLPQNGFMMPEALACSQDGLAVQPDLVQGLPFDLHHAAHLVQGDDGMHDSGPSSTHEVNMSDNDEAATHAFSLPPVPAQNLSAKGAAQVLYKIARSDTDPLGTAGSDSGIFAASAPQFHLGPLSATTDGAAADVADDAMHNGCTALDTDLMTTSSATPRSADMHCAESIPGMRHECTADGIPINSIMGGAVPMMVPWGSLQPPGGMQMLQPGSNGLVPVSQGAQIFLPVQLRAMEGGQSDDMMLDGGNAGYSLVVPPELMTQQLVFNADDMLQCVDANGQPLGLPVLQVAESPSASGFMPGAAGQGLGGIPQEQFLAAIRNTSATEVSATS